MTSIKQILLAAVALCLASTATADNITGRISCSGAGVQGVAVSDGYVIALTDADGRYSFQSEKKNGYIFYTVPSGYEPYISNGFNPIFWQAIRNTDVSVTENHDFILSKVNNDHHIMIFGADAHLAKRTGDRSMYQKGYIASMKKEKSEANAKGLRIYQSILGDLTWDNYWYANSYNLSNFIADNTTYGNPIPLFPVIGNHDNDPGVAASTTTDFDSSKPWRTIVCPNYYSFNLGKVHYVVLDDIFYKNEDTGGSYSTGVVGSRNYTARVEDYELEWLTKDLALVDEDTPIIIMVHIPIYRLSSTFQGYGSLTNFQDVANIVKRFKNVHIISGHTHYNLCAHSTDNPNIMEHNVAAICATWWWTGYTQGSQLKYQICQDGSPAGYSYWDINGTDLNWEFRAIAGNDIHEQMRVYDLNEVKSYMTTNSEAQAAVALYPTIVPTYSSHPANSVLVNVYGYDTSWKVEMFVDGSKLYVTRLSEYDPYHVLTFDVARVKATGAMNTGFATTKNSHMFRAITGSATSTVIVKVTDNFGRVYVKRLYRPAAFGLDFVDNQPQLLLGDVNGDLAVNVSDVSELINRILNGDSNIDGDINLDGEVNVSDVSELINMILAN